MNPIEFTDQINDWNVPEPLNYVPPRWFLEDYEGAEQDAARDIYTAIFWQLRKIEIEEGRNTNLQETVVKARSIATAMLHAAEHAEKLSDTMQRAFFTLLTKVSDHGMQKMTAAEYTTVEEWLIDRLLTGNRSRGEISNIVFLVEQLMPMFKQIGGPYAPERLLAIKENYSRAKAAIPFLRRNMQVFNKKIEAVVEELREEEKTVKNLEEKLSFLDPKDNKYKQITQELYAHKKTLERIEKEKPKVEAAAVAEWTQNMEKALAVIENKDVKAWGTPEEVTVANLLWEREIDIYKGYMTQGKDCQIFLCVVPISLAHGVERSLKNFVEFSITDSITMPKTISEALVKGAEKCRNGHQ